MNNVKGESSILLDKSEMIVVADERKNNDESDLSVIIANYNPDKKKLLKTLDSVLVQVDFNYEIIITDDGSSDDLFDFVRRFFYKKGFRQYVLVKNEANCGTVQNVYNGILMAKGNYVKLLSPGDFFFSKTTLKRWYSLIALNNCDLSFGKVIYYTKKNNEFKIIKYRSSPQLIFDYEHNNIERIVENYVALNDTIHGAAIICKRVYYLKYLEETIGKVKYAEDGLYRLMVYDRARVFYYDENVVFYEYGTGISTQKKSIWTERIDKDIKAIDRLLLSRANSEKEYKYLKETCTIRNSKMRKFIFLIKHPRILAKKLYIKINTKYTDIVIDDENLH